MDYRYTMSGVKNGVTVLDMSDHIDDEQRRVAVVTSATGGIGAAAAEHFASAGWTVVLTGRRDAGQAVADRIGDHAVFVRTDVSDDAAVTDLAQTVVARFGRIDCLINNAGLPGQTMGLLYLDLARFDRLVAVNLRAPLVLAQAFAPTMTEQQHGSIINITSVSGQRAGYSGHDYSTAKAGLLHLTRSLAVELAEHHVRVNSISPGPIVTAIHAKGTAGEAADPQQGAFEELLPQNQPLARAGTPADVARAALFLAGEDSEFLTGQDICVDGGITAGRPWRVFEHDWQVIAQAAQR